MDFYKIRERTTRNGIVEIYPDFRVIKSKDLMVRGRSFYAVWDEKAGLWSTDEFDVPRLVDEEMREYEENLLGKEELNTQVKYMLDFSSNSWMQFRNYIGHISDSSKQLDESLTFSNTEVTKEDYVSRRLPYPLQEGSIKAWDEIVGTLYDPEERAKIEWAIGAIVSGDAKHIQKFLVMYGRGGTGKGTIINIMMSLFEGYYTTFEAKAITGTSNAFATEVFKNNPLVAIQHDGDLSKIEDNSKLNSIVSHEDMTMNEKYKPSYMSRINAFLIMGTNKPVKITDAKSGIIRRLIDVRPSERLIEPEYYTKLMNQVKFELGAIAFHCLELYQRMGKNFYNAYRPTEMMLQTDVFYNFIESYYDIFKSQDGATLKQAYSLYVEFCNETNLEYKMAQYKFREELKNYFDKFDERFELPDGTRVRSWFSGFNAEHFKVQVRDEMVYSLLLEETESLLDDILRDEPAQYSTAAGTPQKFWTGSERTRNGKTFTPKPTQVVSTTLADIDTSKEHYVKVPLNHIVIDFDLTDENGEKSAEKNLEAASQWPTTYAEFSKGGGGVHLHYIYDGDVDELARVYEDGIEIKVYTGDSSLRRRLSRCNNVPVATINSGLPLREKKMITQETMKSERTVRDLISRNLNKEFHAGTKPSMDFIHKILDEAYSSGMSYNVTDMRPAIMAFANNSSNRALECLMLISTMQFQSEETIEEPSVMPKDDRLVFFDCEVYPNLFVVCWKYHGDSNVVRMINPTGPQIEELLTMKLIGFNCRKYDNHILYGRIMGYDNEQLYKLSQKIISNVPGATFGEAYNISYTDIYDFSSKKQSLKKFEIELGITHMESELPWDQPVPDDKINQVVDYCCNDVNATEAVFEDRKGDFVAREILADLSGLPVNSTTQQHTARIVFGDDKKPQDKFVYTDLSEMFPGYEYSFGKSTYRGEITGEGGYVYAEPGMYFNVALLDVASMHPTSIEQLDLFGKEYTKNFSELKAARMAIKHGEYDVAKEMLGGKLARHLTSEEESEALSYALKIVINIVYGLTSAQFENAFRDPRNIDNIVAKRGALFMIELKHFVQSKGFTVAHIKTDSIKIPGATKEIIEQVMDFGDQYGYAFEHEDTYEKMCLVNDAVYIAKTVSGKKPAKWSATGAQFQHPYVFKTLFSKEKIEFDDLCETKQVTTALYLDYGTEQPMYLENDKELEFIGKVGRFVPIQPDSGGAVLLREKDGKHYAATGSKGRFWLEASRVQTLNKEKDIDMDYFEQLVYKAKQNLSQYGDLEQFLD